MGNTMWYYAGASLDHISPNLSDNEREILINLYSIDARFRNITRHASTCDSLIVEELQKAAETLNYDVASGITASCPGFYGPQGRELGIARSYIPDLQGKLARLETGWGDKVVNIEMEVAVQNRLAQFMGYRSGAICAGIANRPNNTFTTNEQYEGGVVASINIALDALYNIALASNILNNQKATVNSASK